MLIGLVEFACLALMSHSRVRRRLHGRARVRRAADEGDAIDPYQVLGVSPDASAEQIRGAYRRLARRCHPDVNPGVDATRFRILNEAYRSLAAGSGGAPRDAAGPAPRPEPAAPAGPPPNRPPDAASGHTGPPDAAGSPLVAAAVLVPLAVVVCAPGPLLLCGVLLAPVGVVLGHLARWQARRAGRPPSGFALVGIVAGWALTAVLVTAVAAGVLVSRS